MTRDEQEAILTIALMAAFADGRKDEREREEVRRIVDALAASGEPNLPELYRRVLTKQVTPAAAAARIADPAMRQLAYEMAVGVCDADGARGPSERDFLVALQRELRLDPADATVLAEQADAIAKPRSRGRCRSGSTRRPGATTVSLPQRSGAPLAPRRPGPPRPVMRVPPGRRRGPRR